MTSAAAFADLMLRGQEDLVGLPAIAHTTRVAASVHHHGQHATAVAWLHDVVEDSPATVQDIENLFGDGIARDVDSLTRREGETYREYMVRANGGSITARRVKLADLRDNLNRGKREGRPDSSLVIRYERALDLILGGLTEGEYLGKHEEPARS